MKLIRLVWLLAFPFYLISCGTQQKMPNYLENVSDSSHNGEIRIPELRIQKNDILSIQIYSSSTKPEIDLLYNLRESTSGTGQNQAATNGFLVDAKGNIEYPRLGSFHAEGLTKDELAAQIKKRLIEPVELLKDPTVIIRFLNLKVTVIGEVESQGVINFPGERVTILEAIGLAGGITEFGKKENVKVVRELDGKRQIGVINLSSDSLFQSPFYTLMQNDVVMVDPIKQKQKQRDQTQAFQRVSFALSVITAAAFIYNIFK
jgi:polysaccharide export outer membrane protein